MPEPVSLHQCKGTEMMRSFLRRQSSSPSAHRGTSHRRRHQRGSTASALFGHAELLEDRTLLSAGTLDPTFGDGGQVITDLIEPVRSYDFGHDIAIVQPDGKILAAGRSLQIGTGYDFALVRYNTDGSLDSSFGNNGSVTTDFGFHDFLQDMAVGIDGKIVVVGHTSRPGAGLDVIIARYNADGTLDSTFGGGKVLIDFGTTQDVATGVAIDAEGRIVLAGSIYEGAAGGYNLLLARYGTDGTLDANFGAGGKITTDFAGSTDRAEAVAIDSAGRIVVAGWSYQFGTSYDFALARYLSDGSLDEGFGTGGRVTTDLAGSFDRAYSIAIDGLERILLAGESNQPGTGYDFALARYDSTGQLDSSFSGDGKATADFGSPNDYAMSIAIDASAGIVAAGATYQAVTGWDLATARFNVDGTLDSGFDGDGRVTTDLDSQFEQASGVVIDPSGRIIVVGETYHPLETLTDFALVRYAADGTLDGSFGSGGKVTTNLGVLSSMFDQAEDVILVQPDGKIVVAGGTHTDAGGFDFGIVRYNRDGSLDSTFGSGGQVTTDFGNRSFDYATSIALQSDGRILVGGRVRRGINGWDVALARYNVDGTLDATFGSGGLVTTHLGTSFDLIRDIAVDGLGRIVLAGHVFTPTNGTDVALVRYTSDGQLDSSFGGTGWITSHFGSTQEGAFGVTIDSRNRPVIAGNIYQGLSGGYNFLLARYQENGSLDPTFGKFGRMTADFSNSVDWAEAIAIDTDGRILAGGWSFQWSNSYDFALARFTADGYLDPTFGTNGRAVADFGGSDDRARALALDSNGRIVLVGESYQGPTGWDFAVARFRNDGRLDSEFSGDGKTTLDFGSPSDYATGVAVDRDHDVIVTGYTDHRFPTGRNFALARYEGSTPPTADAGGPYTAVEGGSVQLDASGSSDPDQDTGTLVYEWDLDGDGVFGETGLDASNGDEVGLAPTFLVAGLDGLSQATVQLRVTDDGAFSRVDTAIIEIVNVAPTLTVVGPTGGVRGQTRTLTLSASDPSIADRAAGFRYEIDWDGDDVVDETTMGSDSIQVGHTFAETGIYVIRVTAIDKDGARSAVAEHSIAIVVVALQEDDDGQMTLAAGGTTGNDELRFSPGENPGEIEVIINGILYGVFQPTGRIQAFGQSGDDDIQVAGGIALSAWLHGGDGHDRLKGGAGHDVLLGGAGDDLLVGGSGRDMIVGGLGADRIVGNADDDVLIAGSLQFSNVDAAITAIMAEWTSSRDIETRRRNLIGNGNGDRNNGLYFLLASDDPSTEQDERTVIDDGSQDVLTGSSGVDWFFYDPNADRVTDLDDEVFANDLDFILGT